ncbi:8365_t:CDS:1 [Acaulospora morrowiae]|uniref:8365_t:CDS:1 n=1 Tax=Acaulospora morrowiae TaxID=94023 RepID=A0A9N9G000_9GLOM|nr:8365_t:CDS:1 [Acaulospora morrowiae]
MKLPLLKPKTHFQIARQNLMMNYTSNKFRNRNIFLTLLIYLENPQNKIDLQKTKIPEIDVQPLIEELKIELLVEDTVKVVNVDKNSTDEQSLAIKLVHLFEKINLAENNTKRAKVEEITSWYQYRKHFEKDLMISYPKIKEMIREPII